MRTLLRFNLLALSGLLAFSASGQTRPTVPSERFAFAGFGGSVVIDGQAIIVGRTGKSTMFPGPATQLGAVHLFEPNGDGTWAEQRVLEATDGAYEDRFGAEMVISGDYLAVAAPGADEQRGAVYLFERAEGQAWSQAARLTAEGSEPGDRFGTALGLSGGVLLVGAPGHAEQQGTVVVFRRDGETGQWAEQARIEGSGAEAGHQFGAGLAFSGAAALIGAPGFAEGKGRVHAYTYDAGQDRWAEQGTLAASDTSRVLFGGRIALEAGRALIAAPGLDPTGGGLGAGQPRPGAVFVYTSESGSWREDAVLTPKDSTGNDVTGFGGAGFGAGLALNGGDVWAGAPLGAGFAGAVYVYEQEEGLWSQAEVLSNGGLSSGAGFGTTLAVRDGLAAVVSTNADFGNGRVFVYTRDASGGWGEQASLADAGMVLSAISGDEVRCSDGEAGQFSCDQVDLLAFLPVGGVGGDEGDIVNDIWGWTDPTTGREYAILGRSGGTAFIDVTNPTTPLYLGNLPQTEGATPNAWRDVKVYADHAFIVADNVGKHGMQVFDLTLLRDLDEVPATFSPTAVYDRVNSAHNVVVNEDTGFAYIVAASGGGETCGGGYHMVDIRDPEHPSFAGCFNDPSAGAGASHIHDAQCVRYTGPDPDHQGKELCFGANATVFSIADVSNKENPTTLAALAYPKVAYVHQGWLTADQRYFYINDEGDEVSGLVDATRTIVWDVTDLDDPVVVTEFMGTTPASDHNLYIRDHLMYQSNYVSGLRIIDISDPVNPREVAFFDTVPWGSNAAGFSGSWSNYPYFESGTIIVSSINEGLFLLKKRDEVNP